MWWLGARQRVAVVLQFAAQVIGETTPAVAAHPAGAVRCRHHPVAGPQSCPVVGDGAPGPDGLDDAEVLVALDDGERRPSLQGGAGVLDGLTPEGVLVRAADTGCDHPQQDGSRFKVSGKRVVPDLYLTWRHQRRRLNADHAGSLPRSCELAANARARGYRR